MNAARRSIRLFRPQSGHASVELVAVLPALIAITLVVAQLVLTGWVLWSASVAARAGARAASVGSVVEAAATAALPGALRASVEVDEAEDGEVRVRIDAPTVIPGLPGVPISVASRLAPESR